MILRHIWDFLGFSSTVSVFSRKFFDCFSVFLSFPLFLVIYSTVLYSANKCSLLFFSEILRLFHCFLGNSSTVLAFLRFLLYFLGFSSTVLNSLLLPLSLYSRKLFDGLIIFSEILRWFYLSPRIFFDTFAFSRKFFDYFDTIYPFKKFFELFFNFFSRYFFDSHITFSKVIRRF